MPSNVAQLARQRAYRRLKEAHAKEFEEYYDEERAALNLKARDIERAEFSKAHSPKTV